MGVFDFFRKKKAQPEEQQAAPEVQAKQQEQEKQEQQQRQESLEEGLQKTRSGFFSKLGRALAGKSTVDVDFLDEVEEALVSADVGVQTTVKIIERLEKRVAKDKYFGAEELNLLLRGEIAQLMRESGQKKNYSFTEGPPAKPYVIMVVGVNGVGKTTTIGKLAHQFKQNGNHVVLGAADTFRAAAVDQLKIWSERAGVEFISRGMNADPAAVAFDAVQAAQARDADVAIIDTAGRLHNKVGLMNELSKIRRVMSKVIPDAPHEVLLVLDATTGQNAIEQAKQFTAATEVNAIALTKLDGTAKGGVVIGIIDQFNIPVKYIGVGEKMNDLLPFDNEEFVKALFK